jgi:hypothetical protein
MKAVRVWVVLCISIGLVFGLVSISHAIPAFTRANNVECTTCHTIFPELNEYGEAFLKNGYVYLGKVKKKNADKPKAAPAVVEAKPAVTSSENAPAVKGDGDSSLLNKLKAGMMISSDAPVTAAAPTPVDGEATGGGQGHSASGGKAESEGILLAGIPEQLPISFTANIHTSHNSSEPNPQPNDYDLSTRTIKLNAGGNFKEKAGFFGTYLLYTETPPPASANTGAISTNGKSDIGEFFLVWRHALETPINFKVGRFQPKLGLWKSTNKLSTTNSFATYAYTVGVSPFKSEQPQDAMEANMIFANRVFLASGLVNRKNQNSKDWYVHTSVKFGGADYLANEPEIDLNKEESILDYLTVTVGGYGYVGTNGDANTIPNVTPRQNNYYRAGADIDVLYKLFRLRMTGTIGEDDNPALTYAELPVTSYVAAVEAEYTILQNFIGSLRFEYQEDGINVVRRYIPTFAYSPIENMKVVAEYKHESGVASKSSSSSVTYVENHIGTLGVTFSF